MSGSDVGGGGFPAQRERGAEARYGVAMLLSALAWLLTMAVRDLLTGSVFLLFFPAIIGAAWYGGLGPALTVIVAAMVTADIWYVEPLGRLSIREPRDVVWLATYGTVATLVAWIAARLARTNAALRESEGRFRAMADHAPVLIWETGVDGACTYLNRPWQEFTGRPVEQDLGDGWAENIHEEDRKRVVEAYRTAFSAHVPFRVEMRLRRHDGEYRWTLAVGTPRRDAAGAFLGYIGSCVDMHEHVEGEQRLQETAAQLEELTVEQEQMVEELQARTAEAENARTEAQLANQAKSRFLAVMSHELRTPLNAILGYADLLGGGVGGDINQLQARHVARIRDSVMHLRDLIDQILSLSRIEAGREELNIVEFDLGWLIRRTVEMVAPQAAKRQLVLDVRLPEARLPVHADEGKVRQILLNLLSNAVKFTERGEIRVEAALDGEASVCIRVRDTGVGIAAADMKRIFEPFTQVDQSMTRRAAGTGLGLSVSRQLAELMGGTLTVSSTLGQGSTFRLDLPLDISAYISTPPPVERRRNTPA